MRIKTKITIFFVFLIVLVVLIFLSISYYLKNNYMEIKYNRANDYYYQNDITLDEYSEYLIAHGFIVTTDEVDKYMLSTGDTCHLDSKEIIVYDGQDPALYAIINESISNDLLMIINVIMLLVTIMLIILLMIIYVFIQKVVINRIKRLENQMQRFDIDRVVDIEVGNAKDEVFSLIQEFTKMANNLNAQDEKKQELIVTLSHELKNPLSKIEATLDLYKAKAPGYTSKEKIILAISRETKYLTDNINKLLFIYSGLELGQNIEQIALKEYLTEAFTNEVLISRGITLKEISDDLILNVDVDRFDIIINNIINNMYKYAKRATVIEIKVSEKEIVFINEVDFDSEIKSTKLGNVINEYIVKELGFEYSQEYSDNKYYTKIILM